MGTPASFALGYAVDELLRDGGSIRIRAVRPDDKDRLREHFHSLSARSVYTRFFRHKRELTPEELVYFTEMDGVEHVGLVATLRSGGAERIIGVGRYFRRSDVGQPHLAEVAFAVSDSHQRRGIASVLLDHLARIARASGITEFSAEVLGENNRMMDVFAKSGFGVRRSIEAGVFHLTFPTADTPTHQVVSHDRERHAAALSVRPLLAPASVAVVGAPPDDDIAALLVRNIVEGGFPGAIFPVHPGATEIAGVRAFPSIAAVGQSIELAVIATPAALVPAAAAECADAGVRAVVVVSSGFREASAEGAAAERELLALVRGSGMRMVGPNSVGVLSTDLASPLNATFAPRLPPAGCVAMLSQSGALGLAAVDRAAALGIGLSSFVSVGNKADVSGNDMLAYWAQDARTRVILLYLESFGNPRKFARVAPEVARDKPILAVKSGRSAAARHAPDSRSSVLASIDIAVEALFEQTGVIRTDTMAQLFDVAALMATQPVPAGPRVAVVTNAAGPALLLADACAARGLSLPQLAPATAELLAPIVAPHAGSSNPVDLGAVATPEQYRRAVEIVGADPGIDSVIVGYAPVMPASVEDVARAIAEGAGAVPADKPVLATFLSSHGAPAMLSNGPRGSLPSYDFPEDAAMALAAAERYGRWRRRPAGRVETLSPFAREAVRAVVDRVLEGASGPTWVGGADLATILRAAGIPYADSIEVSVADVADMAERTGYPLAAKIAAPFVLRKTEEGAVALDLQSSQAVTDAVSAFSRRMEERGTPLERVLLQRYIPGGIETMVGVTVDPLFGPLVLVRTGGVLAELLEDAAFHLTPVTDVDAGEMLARLRGSRLFDGYGGGEAGDKAALADIILRVSALVEAVPELIELELSPIKVLAPGSGAVTVDGRMRLAPPG